MTNPARYADPELQNRILDALLEENGPMAIGQLGQRISVDPVVVAGNLGQLQAKEQVRRVEGEAETITRYEITPMGILRARGPRHK